MTRRLQGALFLAVALVAATGGFLLSPLAGAPKVDTGVLLATSLPDLQGERRQVGEWRGKVLVVNFWATWCKPCMFEMPEVKNIWKKYKSDQFIIIGVSLDNNESELRSYLEREGITWPQYFDGKYWNNDIAVSYGVKSIPATFLVAAQRDEGKGWRIRGELHRPPRWMLRACRSSRLPARSLTPLPRR